MLFGVKLEAHKVLTPQGQCQGCTPSRGGGVRDAPAPAPLPTKGSAHPALDRCSTAVANTVQELPSCKIHISQYSINTLLFCVPFEENLLLFKNTKTHPA